MKLSPGILVTISLFGSLISTFTMARSDEEMPTFMEKPCSKKFLGTLCINVTFPNGHRDTLVLTRKEKGSSIYKGYLHGDDDVSVVMIDTPATKSRLINFNSENVPHCAFFDVDLKADTVKCVHGGFSGSDVEGETNVTQREITWTNGPIIPLGSYYGPSGIPLKVLFTFDTKFYNEFNGKDGKTADEYMDQVIEVVKNAFTDESLKKSIGTTVNIIGTKKLHGSALPISSLDCEYPSRLGNLARRGGDYDLFSFITSPGAQGGACLGQVCKPSKLYKINWNAAYGPNECNNYNPDERNPKKRIDCTKTANRIALTAQTIAHEIGHNLGMEHDFIQSIYEMSNGRKYVYRKYRNKNCRGLMDYIDDGVGWSKCSARDFSRHITSEGDTSPCLEAVPQTFTKKVKTRCSGKYGKKYSTLAKAKKACSSDRKCKGVYSRKCNKKPFRLCKGSFKKSRRNSCTYRRTVPQTFTKKVKTRCSDKYGKKYSTLDKAKKACSSDRKCKGVYSRKCNKKPFRLCRGSFKKSRRNSCTYQPTDH